MRCPARPSNEAKLSSMNVAQHPFSPGVLEALQELGGESGGFVEAEAVGGGVGVPVSLDSLEESVHPAKVKVEPSGPKAGARSAARWLPARPSSDAKLSSMNWGLRLEPKQCRKLTVPIDADSGAVGQAFLRVANSARSRMWRTAVVVRGAVVKEGPQTFGNRQHELAHRARAKP